MCMSLCPYISCTSHISKEAGLNYYVYVVCVCPYISCTSHISKEAAVASEASEEAAAEEDAAADVVDVEVLGLLLLLVPMLLV